MHAQAFCTSCGAPRGPGAFCPSCGRALDGSGSVPATPGIGAVSLAAVAVIAGGILYGVGAFLPWVSVTAGFVGTVTRSGMEGGDGWVALAIAAAVVMAGAASLRDVPRTRRMLMIVVGIGAAGFTLFEYNDVRQRIASMDSTFRDLATPGLGLYLMGVAAAIVVIATLRLSPSAESAAGKAGPDWPTNAH